ncbi:hypothetical protein [Kibdelosporangium aridum]|nr:hypothetical protein [Kibdelosporangium aridum]
MQARALTRNLSTIFLLCMAVVMVVVTLMSPTAAERDAAIAASRTFTMPPVPPLPPKELVPVRSSKPAKPPGPGEGVALRQLVIAVDANDPGLAAWKSILDTLGTPYDVVLARSEPFDFNRLVRPDGVGRYQSILLSDAQLPATDDTDNPTSVFDSAKWTALWDYEKKFGVRQVALSARPGTVPEDYCLRPGTEQTVDGNAVQAAMTQPGAAVFQQLKPDAKLPIANANIHLASLQPGCSAEPLLTIGSAVIGVRSDAPDGRQRIALSFETYVEERILDLIGHGLVRWATKGVFAGEKRHWINVDVDDWFNSTLRVYPDGAEGAYRLTGPEVVGVKKEQDALRAAFPLARDFTLNLPYNAGLFDPGAPAVCSPEVKADELSAYSKCMVNEFRWLNHTYSHPAMHTTSYERNRKEIADNLTAAAEGGIPVPVSILKTPEYSGLGAYRSDPNSRTEEPKDHGLRASNKDLLKAMSDLGVKYIHGDMSHAGQRPECFNCGIYHPLQPDVMVVPDWPTDIEFEAATPEEQTALYNLTYGKNGTDEGHFSKDLTYEEITDREAELALKNMISGSAYAHTVHQANMHQYAKERSLTFDWVRVLVQKYSNLYQVPLKNPDWVTLAQYVKGRNTHFDALKRNEDPVWNRVSNEISYAPSGDGLLYITGLDTKPAGAADQVLPDAAENYGSDSVSRVNVSQGSPVTLSAKPRS